MAQQGRSRQERAEDTRAAIIVGAAHEFDDHGYAGASMDAVAERAGVTKGALYFHFVSKAELAGAVIAEQHAISRRYGEAALAKSSSPLETLMWVSQGLATQMVSEVMVSAGVRLSTEAATAEVARQTPYTDWMTIMADLLAEGIAVGQVQDTWDPALLGRVVVATFTGVQTVSDVMSDRADLFERLRELWTVLFAGIVTDRVRPDVPRLVAIIAPTAAP